MGWFTKKVEPEQRVEMYIPFPPGPERNEKIWAEVTRRLGGFIRVRGSAVGDPLHEFDIPASLYERHPGRYTVVDPVISPGSRPMRAVAGANVPDLTNDAPSEGDSEGDNNGI